MADYYFAEHNNIKAALEYGKTALSFATSTKEQSAALQVLAIMNWVHGDYLEGQTHANEAQRLARISGDLWRQITALRIGAMFAQALGSYRNALVLCSKARELITLCGLHGSLVRKMWFGL